MVLNVAPSGPVRSPKDKKAHHYCAFTSITRKVVGRLQKAVNGLGRQTRKRLSRNRGNRARRCRDAEMQDGETGRGRVKELETGKIYI